MDSAVGVKGTVVGVDAGSDTGGSGLDTQLVSIKMHNVYKMVL